MVVCRMEDMSGVEEEEIAHENTEFLHEVSCHRFILLGLPTIPNTGAEATPAPRC